MPAGSFLPATAGAPALQPAAPAHVSESRRGVIEGALVTLVALAASFALTQFSGRIPIGGIDRAVRTDLFVTLVFYIALGAALTWYVTAKRVNLVWFRGAPVDAVLLGLPVGLVFGALGVGVNSLAQGRLAGDPSAELWVGGGGVLRLGLVLIVSSVAAPLLEEVLFRGIAAGSVLARGPAPALLLSAGAFAIWHMKMDSLRYYWLMGLLFGGLWLKRGLLASMTAHAVFNGVLTFAAIAATSGAGQLAQANGMSFLLPGGWHRNTAMPGAYDGP